LLVSGIGTAYEFDARDAILFLEEVGEDPYRIDRMLNQLRLAGKLRTLTGVVLGRFERCSGPGTNTTAGQRVLDLVLRDYFADLGVPVIAKVPAGHVDEQVTLPIGARVRLNATDKTLEVLGTTRDQ
jgi:muramoyltetrapeptide carboxypeptidase